MDAEALKIILDLQRELTLYKQGVNEVFLHLHSPYNCKTRYVINKVDHFEQLHDEIHELKSKARQFDELQKQRKQGDNQ